MSIANKREDVSGESERRQSTAVVLLAVVFCVFTISAISIVGLILHSDNHSHLHTQPSHTNGTYGLVGYDVCPSVRRIDAVPVIMNKCAEHVVAPPLVAEPIVEEEKTLESSVILEQNACYKAKTNLSESDIDMARTAWVYFENNYNPQTGLVNAVNNYPSTTMWDTGSALAATIAALDFGFIEQKEFDDRITAMISALTRIKLFNDEAPNKVYNTKTLEMVNYANKATEKGIGVSALDLARLMSWTSTLACMHPKYANGIKNAISRWDFSRLVQNDQMYGLAINKKDPDSINVWQEGRLGYEQYAGKIFAKYGFKTAVAASYENEYRDDVEIMGVNIAHDSRDPREWHANNYVLTESYTMDAMELGVDSENKELIRNIFEVQKKRWLETGIVTAISEDNINQAPWFLYNTIFNAGKAWQTTNSADKSYDHLKSISTKAAISMALLFPEDEYSRVLLEKVESAYDPTKGWYSGIYESGAGYNTVTTANTNGVILSGLLYKKYGALLVECKDCDSEPTLLIEQSVDRTNVTECTTCDGG